MIFRIFEGLQEIRYEHHFFQLHSPYIQSIKQLHIIAGIPYQCFVEMGAAW